MPSLTVLMSVHNGIPYLNKSIESVLSQTHSDFEFLIINDGSEDDSGKQLEFFNACDQRITLITNATRIGLGASLAKGLSIASGDLIARMDADDIAVSSRLEQQIAFLHKHPEVSIVGSCARDIGENEDPIRERRVPETHDQIIALLPYVNPMIHSSVIFRKQPILDTGSYDKDLSRLQDYELWFRCAAAGLQFANIQKPLLLYRVNKHYYSRKGFKYRITDIQVRMRGYQTIRLTLHKRLVGLFIPLILSLVPPALGPLFYKLAKKLDPRQKIVR